MQIKELIIKNFKSFDFVKIPFNLGLYVIVGPNGSGKSNIVDALLFVFGVTSLKKLRVDKLSNLINHNTKAKTAKVRCILENNGEEIEISREIDKDGKSVFYLNNNRKPLHEISSYLSALGIDTNGYNTVQQGDVTKIINLNPEERRGIIDDISGISLFDDRKKEAEINLKKVQERLDKVSIALNERKPYVEQLKEEKENAIKYKELERKENNLNYNLYKKQIDYYTQEINNYSKEIEEKENKVNYLISEKKKYENELKQLENKLEFINSELISHSEKVQSTIGKEKLTLSANKEIVQNNININNDNLNYLISENEKASNLLTSYKVDKENILKIINLQKDKINFKNKIKDQLKIELSNNQKEYEKIKSIQEELYNNLSNFNKELVSKQDIYFEKKNRINAYNLQKDTLENKNKEINKQIIYFKNKQKELSISIYSFKQNIKQISSKLSLKKQELLKNKTKNEKIIDDINNLKINLASLKKDLSLSENIVKKKKEFNEKLKKYSSFVGFLEDIIPLDTLQKSNFSSYIVLKNDSEVKNIIKSFNYNFSFVILSVLGISKENLSNYFNKSFPKQNKKINVDGFYFDGFCFKKMIFKDVNKLEMEISLTSNKIEELLDDVNKLNEKDIFLEKEINILEKEINDASVNLNTKIEIKKEVDNNLENINIQTNTTKLNQITSNIGQLNIELNQITNEIKKYNQEKEKLEDHLKKINLDTHNTIRDDFDNIVSEINNLEQSLISKFSEEKILTEKIDNKINYIDSNSKKINEIKDKLIILNDQKVEIDNNLLKINKYIEEEDSKKSDLFKQKSEINSKINKISQDMHIFDYDINDINMSLNNAKIMISTNQSKLSQIEQNLIFLNIDKDNMKLLDVSLEEINSDLRKTKRDKNSLGNINFNAIESYDKLAKEYDEIKSKCEILEKEKEQVLSMLNEINLKKETVFMDCFNKISKEFKNNVKNMSKFLSGELELVGDDILTSKLTINLTKNNKTKELDIMSGGEKTVTALAFIFSLHSYKNAPFYILDEVDAALDDYNSLSLLNFVKNISKYTIILSISHNSTMVSGADQIIGVTLKENTSIIGLNINK